MNRNTVILIVLTLLAIVDIEAKVITRNVSLTNFKREGGWIFLDRMTIQPGTLQIDMDIKLSAKDIRNQAAFNLQLALIPADIWPVESIKKCNVTNYTQEELRTKASRESVREIYWYEGNSFSYRSLFKEDITEEIALNIVIRDCELTIRKENFGRGSNVDISLSVVNNGEHQTSSEMAYGWMLPLSLVLCLGTIFFLRKNNQDEENEENWVKAILKVSLWIAFSATLLKYAGYFIYAYMSGQEHQFFNFMYLLLYSVSDSVIIVLLLLLAFGWTVTFHSTNDFDLYVPLASMLGMINIIMTTINMLTDGDHDKYHIFDSIPAYIMVFFKLVGFVVFMVGVMRCVFTLKQDDVKVMRYFIQLGILGTIYMTFIPISLILVNILDSHSRKEAMFFIIQGGKYALCMWMGYLCGSKKSIYRNIQDGSFMEKGEKYF